MSVIKKGAGPDDIGCLEAIETLYAYLDGELDDPATLAKVEDHLGHCRSCYSRKEMEQALTGHIRGLNKRRTPAGLQTRLRKLMDGF
jgi:anti-sigma factor (TIGR02949 family)